MAGGDYDSSVTRVEPVFDQLRARPDDWVRPLLNLTEYGSGQPPSAAVNLTCLNCQWGEQERGLAPPVALLAWLIRHLKPSPCGAEASPKRVELIAGKHETIESTLGMLRGRKPDREPWYILEGPTYPDAFIETTDALVVIEGKRTESGPTTHTTWKANRHQIWRHMDAAWEIRGRRAVYGMLLVEGMSPHVHEVPPVWRRTAEMAIGGRSHRRQLPASRPDRTRRDHQRLPRRCNVAEGLCALRT